MDLKPITVYVATHKEVDLSLPSYKKKLFVGAYKVKKELPSDYLRDDVGESISTKNANYSELTGLYWIWKHNTSAYVGLEHYRRFFTRCICSFFSCKSLEETYLRGLLDHYDLILPQKTWLFWTKSIRAQYEKDHIKRDLDLTEQIIKTHYPDYVPYFNQVMNHRSTYFFNMFIGKKELIDAYAEWLFGIFSYLEKDIDLTNRSPYQGRVYGFLSERLFTVWVLKNKPKIKQLPVCFKNFSLRQFLFPKH